jgi:hypothetical protein
MVRHDDMLFVVLCGRCALKMPLPFKFSKQPVVEDVVVREQTDFSEDVTLISCLFSVLLDADAAAVQVT